MVYGDDSFTSRKAATPAGLRIYIYMPCINMSFLSFLSIPLYKPVCSQGMEMLLNDIAASQKTTMTSFFSGWYSLCPCIYFDFESSAMAMIDVLIDSEIMAITYKCHALIIGDAVGSLPDAELYDARVNQICGSGIYEVHFSTRGNIRTLTESYTIQPRVHVSCGESNITFFRLYNPTAYPMMCYTVYFVTPPGDDYYITKLQCFCLELLHLCTHEILDLPVLYVVDESIGNRVGKSFNAVYPCHVISGI